MIKINAYDPKKDKEVFAGVYDTNNRTFIKTVTKRHYMIKEKGYAIQAEVMDMLNRWGCQKIIIKTKTKIYSVKFNMWYKSGTVKNYGHGDQNFFPVKFMKEEKK